MASHKELAAKLDELDKRVTGHDEAIRQLVAAIRQLMAPTASSKKRQIGFHAVASADDLKGKSKARKR
jgi:hypothetical protein